MKAFVGPEGVKKAMLAFGELMSANLDKDALHTGDDAPEFTLNDVRGGAVSSKDLLSDSMLIVSFIRGSWCPHCVAELRAMQTSLSMMNAVDVNIVVVSPQKPDKSIAMMDDNELNCTILYDGDLEVAKKFGVAFQPSQVITDFIMYILKIDMYNFYADGGATLPIPAIFTINMDGKIIYDYVNPNWTERAEPSEYLERFNS